MADATHTARRSKQFASEYTEQRTDVDIDELTADSMRHYVFDITYATNGGTRTIRAHGALTPYSSRSDLSDAWATFHHDGRRYALNPCEQRLITVNRDGPNRTVAQGDEIRCIERIDYPERAPVEGAPQTDVEATIYYRSPRSESMQEVTIDVDSLYENDSEIYGHEVGTGRRIQAYTRWDRDIVSKHGTSEVTLGKVARVEFPAGHQFTVDVADVPDDKVDQVRERIEQTLNSKFSRRGYSVSVEHDGRMEGQ